MSYRSLRWIIVALLFVASAVNYIDRQTLSILSPQLRQEFHLSDQDYANIVTAFLIPYTVMYSVGGRLMDRFGARLGLVASFAWWSVATMLTGFARSGFMLGAFRFLLGVGEPCVFPGGIKVCREWFPARLRAMATGIFSSGSSIGAVLAPPLVAWLTLQFGWRYAFVIPGALGLAWLPIWWHLYRPAKDHPAVTPEDHADIEAGRLSLPTPPWRELLRRREVWALIIPRLFSDPVWYFYLFWLPDYLQRERHFSLAQIGFYGWIPFLFADLGAFGGGSLSDWLVRRGYSPSRARLTILIGVGFIAPLGALAGIVPSVVVAIAVTCLVAFLTQCWAVNIATLASDLMPESTGTVTGMMGTAGSFAGAIFAQILGLVIAHFGYPAAFTLAAVLHPCAATILTLLLPSRRA